MRKRFTSADEHGHRKAIAEFRLEGDVVEIVWLVPGLDRWMALDSIVVGGRELKPADGHAFFDGLDKAYPGSIETVA